MDITTFLYHVDKEEKSFESEKASIDLFSSRSNMFTPLPGKTLKENNVFQEQFMTEQLRKKCEKVP